MRLKRVISLLVCIFTLVSMVLPADAAININGGGGNLYSGPGGGGAADWDWSPGNINNMFGYRISVYYS